MDRRGRVDTGTRRVWSSRVKVKGVDQCSVQGLSGRATAAGSEKRLDGGEGRGEDG